MKIPFLSRLARSKAATEEPLQPAPQQEPTAEELEARPEPNADLKPESPQELKKPTLKYILKATAKEFSQDGCTDLAAALTYYGVLALFPAAIALVSILALLGQGSSALEALLDIAAGLGGRDMVESVREPLLTLASQENSGLLLFTGLAGALWSASGYIGAFGRASNRIYEIEEGRPFWMLRPLNLLLTAGLLLGVALVAVFLVLTGPIATEVGQALGLGDTLLTVWQWGKWPVVLGLVAAMIAVLYHWTPNVRQPKFRWLSPGAGLALLVWILASTAFGFYVSNFGSYDKTYGALASAIVFLLWLWLTNLVLLLGAELNAELERGRELQSGLPAEEHVLLPPRSTRGIEKREEQEAEARREGRALKAPAGRERKG